MSPKSFWYSQRPVRAILSGNKTMPDPYGLEIIESCMNCPHREERLFCNLPPASVQKLSAITSPASYPKGAMLFVEGQSPRGVFIMCSGKVKLSTTSRDGKTIITKISDAGDVLGLNAVISNVPYEVTAEMMEPGQANFIPRESLQLFVKEFPEVRDVHEFQFKRIRDRLYVSCHCTLPDEMPLSRVHDVQTALETRFKQDAPELFRVLIHPEPVTDNRR